MAQASPVEQTGANLVFEDNVEVNAPIAEVYQRWTDFAHFPDFMSNIEEVRPLGNDRYHWVARIFGVKQEWDAQTTARDPNRRVAWHSLNGAYNAGTVTFQSLGADRTRVNLRMEYAPPGGKIGQTLDQVTQITRNEVHEDLTNFQKLISGQPTGGQSEQHTVTGIVGQDEPTKGFGKVMSALLVPAAAAAAGGVASYIIGDRVRKSRVYQVVNSPIALPARIGSWAWLGASAASVITSATFRSRGQASNALFVGQWAPTFLGFGILTRLLGHRGVQTNLPTSVASWSLVSACLGSIIASVTLHAQGKRVDGLFVGQWAPTFLGAALFTRLFNRVFDR